MPRAASKVMNRWGCNPHSSPRSHPGASPHLFHNSSRSGRAPPPTLYAYYPSGYPSPYPTLFFLSSAISAPSLSTSAGSRPAFLRLTSLIIDDAEWKKQGDFGKFQTFVLNCGRHLTFFRSRHILGVYGHQNDSHVSSSKEAIHLKMKKFGKLLGGILLCRSSDGHSHDRFCTPTGRRTPI